MNARWASPSRQSVAFRHAVGIIVAAIISLIGVPAQAQQSQNSALPSEAVTLSRTRPPAASVTHPEVPTGERSRAKRCPAGG